MSALVKAPGSLLGVEKAPLVIEDPERAKKLEELRSLIGKKMAAKFKTVRQCFHYIDAEHKGSIVCEDIHQLFKNLHLNKSIGWTDLADQFFDLLNLDGNEEIDFHELQAFVGPYIHPGHCPAFVSSSNPGSGLSSHFQKGKFFPIEHHDNVKNMYTTSYGGFSSDGKNPHVPTALMPGYGGFVPRAAPGKPRTHETPDIPLFPKSRRGSETAECLMRSTTAPEYPQTGTCTPHDSSSLNAPRRNSIGAITPRDSNPFVAQHEMKVNFKDSMPFITPRRDSGWTPRNQEHALRRLNEAAMTVGSGFFSSRSTLGRASLCLAMQS